MTDTKVIKPEDNKAGTFTETFAAATTASVKVSPVPTQAPGIIVAEPGTAKEEAIYFQTKDDVAGTINSLTRDYFGTLGGAEEHANGEDWEVLQSARTVSNIVDALVEGFLEEQTTIARVDDDTFTTSGDRTSIFTEGRIVRFNQDATKIDKVLTSSYSSGTGLTTVNTAAAVTISNPLTKVEYAIQPKNSTASAAVSSGASFWTAMPGTPTRVSDTQFTITDTANADKYNKLFSQGVELRWLESSTVNTAKVRSSSYSSNAVTVNLVGDSLTAGFTTMEYAIPSLVSQVDGWTADIDTWVYASASTFTIAGVDKTAVFTPGTRLKFTQTTDKYAVVVSSSFSTNTTVTIAVNTDYTIANAVITAPYYSYQANPQGYPAWFAFTPSETWTNPPTSRTTYAKFSVIGRMCTMLWGTHGTQNASNSTASVQITVPIPVANKTITRHPVMGSAMWTDTTTYTDFGALYATTSTNLFADFPSSTRRPSIATITASWEI